MFIPSLLALLCLPEMEKAAAWCSSREGRQAALCRGSPALLQDDPEPVGSWTGMQQDIRGVVCPTGILWGPPEHRLFSLTALAHSVSLLQPQH